MRKDIKVVKGAPVGSKANPLDAPVPIREIPPEVADKSQKHGDFWADVIIDFDGGIDLFMLNSKDPNFEYRFLNSDEKNLIMKTSNILLDRGGWRICPREHLEKIGIPKEQISPDGFCRRGIDTILAFMPKELYKKKMEHKQKLANAPIDQINRLLKEGDSTIGGKDVHPTMKGIQTKEQLHFKD